MNKLCFLVLLLFGAFFLQTAFAVDCNYSESDPTVCNPAPSYFVDLGDARNNFSGLLHFLIEMGVGIVSTLSLALLIYGAVKYLTSQGDQEQAESGKRTMTHAIMGLIIVILSYIVIVVIINALKGSV
ncbi:MAG: hypothetical protein HY336_01570 [Candidatus Doudnabacteria bacterium]|nr:hypothetical protein [Candidatus Doudnabacteria bacterium]